MINWINLEWLSKEWFNILQSSGIILTLMITIVTLRRDIKSRRVTNYLTLIQYHRDIWRIIIEKPALNRVRSIDPDLRTAAITTEEQQFLTFLFLHITCAYEMQKQGHIIKIEMLKYDVGELLCAPITRRFWEENKRYYNADFVKFIDSTIKTDANWLR